MLPYVLLLLLPVLSLGGTPCPPRENLYPCSCANIHQSKRIIHTVVTCHRLPDSRALSSLVATLRTMQIEQFHLYDSFWSEAAGGSLPEDWFTTLKVKEWEIVDTKLSSCFACQWKRSCKNTLVSRFTLINSTSTDLCPLCARNFPWTGCLARLQQLQMAGGALEAIGGDVFSLEMSALHTLNLTRNNINNVEPSALAKLPALAFLDLSHNALVFVNFLGKSPRLQFVDLSWNNIHTIGPIFGKLPSLTTFKVESNDIVELKEADWKDAPASLFYVDLNDNPLHCDCSVRFVNSTFHVSAVVRGTCASPDEYEGSLLRKASRLVNERCDVDGKLGTRPPKKLVTLAA